VLVAHCCDDVAVLLQSLISCVAALPSLFSPLPPRLVCVCVLQGEDAMYHARDNGFGPEVEVRHTAVPVMV
jgi:hypothetical protein